MRVKKQSIRTERMKKKVDMTSRRQDKTYQDNEKQKNAQRVADYRNIKEYEEQENQEAKKRMQMLRTDDEKYKQHKEQSQKFMSEKRTDKRFTEEENKAAKARMAKLRLNSPQKQKEREERKQRLARQAKTKTEKEMEKKRLEKAEKDRIRRQKRAEKAEILAQSKLAKQNASYAFRLNFEKQLDEDIRNREGKFSHDEIESMKAYREFARALHEVPNVICSCCEGTFFKESTVKFDLQSFFNKYQEAHSKISKKKQDDEFVKTIEEFSEFFVEKLSDRVCKTCASYFKRAKIPLVNPKCGLKIKEVPDVVKDLTDLEVLLISPIIAFIQIVENIRYARYSQLGAKGAVVLIEPDRTVFLDLLPRTFDQMSEMFVELARRVDHKSTYEKGLISVPRVLAALRYLITTPLFKKYNIQVDEQLLKAYDPDIVGKQANYIPIINPEQKLEEKDNVKVLTKTTELTKTKKLNDDDEIPAEELHLVTDLAEQEEQKRVNQPPALPLSSYELFPNRITYNDVNKTLDIFDLCPFNATAHALFGPYKHVPELKQIVDSHQEVEFFKLIKTITETVSPQQQQQLWINYIVKAPMFENIFNFSTRVSGDQVSVRHDPSDLLEQFFTDYPSYTVFTNCRRAKCNGVIEFNSTLMQVFGAQMDVKNQLANDIEAYLRNIRDIACNDCNEKISPENYSIVTNELIAISINFATVTHEHQNDLIAFNEIPTLITIRNIKYKLISVVKHIAAEHSSHYVCYILNSNQEVIEINDLPSATARRVAHDVRLTPHVIFYVREIETTENNKQSINIVRDLNVVSETSDMKTKSTSKKKAEGNITKPAAKKAKIDQEIVSITPA